MHQGVILEIAHWQAGTTPYLTRTFDDVNRAGRWKFIAIRPPEHIRSRYVGDSVHQHLLRRAQNSIAYVGEMMNVAQPKWTNGCWSG